MNFKRTTEYALRIMSFMATDQKRLFSSNEIFENLNIPFRYLRKILLVLSKDGMINSVQGKYGGYRITRELSKISLLDIIRAVGDDQINKECFFGFQNCAFSQKCSMHYKWASVRENVNQVLSSTTLDEVNASGSHNYIEINS